MNLLTIIIYKVMFIAFGYTESIPSYLMPESVTVEIYSKEHLQDYCFQAMQAEERGDIKDLKVEIDTIEFSF